jgi:hypothetical protein
MDSTSKFIRELEKHLPIYFQPTSELRQIIRKQGKIINKNSELKVTKVFDSGDTGGIVCAIEDDGQVFIVSLTHLRIKQGHPLRDMILNYQKQRVNYLKNE